METLEQLYIKYKPLVYRYLYRVCGDGPLAEEITQETFFQITSLCCSESGFVPEYFFQKKPVESQIYRLAGRLLHQEQVHTEIEQPAGFSFLLSEEIPTLEYLPESSAVEQAEQWEIRELVMHLNEPVRRVISLRYYEEMQYKEIAVHLQKSENWVKYMLHSGKMQIERKLHMNTITSKTGSIKEEEKVFAWKQKG